MCAQNSKYRMGFILIGKKVLKYAQGNFKWFSCFIFKYVCVHTHMYLETRHQLQVSFQTIHFQFLVLRFYFFFDVSVYTGACRSKRHLITCRYLRAVNELPGVDARSQTLVLCKHGTLFQPWSHHLSPTPCFLRQGLSCWPEFSK